MKMNDFPVYLSDISAKTASLVHRQDMMSCTGEGNKVAALWSIQVTKEPFMPFTCDSLVATLMQLVIMIQLAGLQEFGYDDSVEQAPRCHY